MAYESTSVSTPLFKKNCAWPLQRAHNGWKRVSQAQRAEAALRHLLRTPRGSYYSRPDYGISLYKYRTQGVPESQQDVILADIRRAAAEEIPDITVHSAEVLMRDSDHRLEVTCVWTLNVGNAQWHKDLGAPRKLTTVI